MQIESAAVKPAVYGQSERPPRGDYERGGSVRVDYTCPQNYEGYTAEDHETYRRLYERQAAQLMGLACDAFIDALPLLGAREQIPRFEEINERLYRATRWEVVAVPGLIPELAFFSLLANRKFPVTDWIRKPEEFDYIVEPDVFHDLFGHVPMLFNPDFADYVQRYGEGGIKAHRLDACEKLARLYWYTVEFGLIRQSDGLRAYGAGILSSVGELKHAVRSADPHRLPLSLIRAMRSTYKIDSYQSNYFVIESFSGLFELTAPDFEPLYRELARLPDIEAGMLQSGECTVV